jgi:hypothetical protein
MNLETGDDSTDINRRQFLRGAAALGGLAVTVVPSGLIENAEAQEAKQEAAYEKQESKVPSSAEMDEVVRTALREKKNVVEFVESGVFGGGGVLAGIEAFEFVGGIDDMLGRFIERGRASKQDTSSLEQLRDKARALRNVAGEAHIEFLHQITEYVVALVELQKTDTMSNAERLRAQALTLARANDALVALRDKVREVLK